MAAPTQQDSNRVFCVDDTCAHSEVREILGLVERTFGDVDTHEPDPAKDFPEGIQKDSSVPQADFERFLLDGIPPKGTALVTWQARSTAELIPESKLILLERSFVVGDVVKRDARQAMSGTVIGTVTECDILPVTIMRDVLEHGRAMTEAVQNQYIHSVPTAELYNAHEYREGCVIVYDDWIGIIEDCEDEITVRLGNGSVVVVENPEELESPGHVPLERYSVGDFITTKKGNLRRGRWKMGAFNPNVPPKGTVVEVRPVLVSVSWLCMRIGAPPRPVDPGSFTVNEKPPDVLELSELDSGNVQVYDPAKVPPGTQAKYKAADVKIGDRVRFWDLTGAAAKYDGTRTIENGLSQGKLNRLARTATSGYDMNVFLVAQTWTKVRTLWQDLSITEEQSTALIPDPNIDDENEVWPGEIVHSTQSKPGGRTTIENGENVLFEPAKVGIVQSVRSADRIALIRWCPNADAVFFGAGEVLSGAKIGQAIDELEEVSLYDVKSSHSLSRRRGDIVMIHPDAIPPHALSSNAIGLSWVGEVVDLDLNGLLTVRLGLLEPVTDIQLMPEQVTLAYSYDMAEMFMGSHTDDTSDDDDDDESMAYGDSDLSRDDYNELWYEYQRPDGTRVQVPEDQDEGDEAWSTEDEDGDLDGDVSMAEGGEVNTSSTTPLSPSDPEITKPPSQQQQQPAPTSTPSQTSIPTLLASAEGGPELFAILESAPPSDHHFFSQPSASDALQHMRRIAKEHKILRSSLPEGIFVRTWESRLDLLRVIIIGPTDTPYEYAPFLIDFHMGSSFPNTPPQAFFHSWTNGNGPVNPNLYEDGKICLSLLGTWHADERHENWNPAKSTILQLLVSIMGLVLVKQPYYNEAGYEIRAGTEETILPSSLYSERTYFRSRSFITHAIQHQVSGFEDVIQWLYLDKGDKSPKLLEKAIVEARSIIENSQREGGQHDGLRRISRGAVILLQRAIQALESAQSS